MERLNFAIQTLSFFSFRYTGELKNDSSFKEAISKDSVSVEYSRLVSWIVSELASFYALSETSVNAMQSKSFSSVSLLFSRFTFIHFQPRYFRF